MSLVDALKNGSAQYTGNTAKNVTINVGNGDSNITVRGEKVSITAGTGNQNVVVLGNDVDIKLDRNAAANWNSALDNDTVAVISDLSKTNKITIDTGAGNDTALAVSNNVTINMGDGNHLIGFWGDNVTINAGNGSNNIYTMDKMIKAGILDDTTNILGVNVGKAATQAIEADTVEYTEQLYDITSSAGTNKSSFLTAMQSKYNLDASNMKELEALYDSGELFQTYTQNGVTVPKYNIMQSVKQKNADGTAKYILCRTDGVDSSGYIHTRGWQDGTFKECVATKTRAASSYTEQQTFTREVATRDVLRLDGTKNLSINVGSGDYNVIDVTSTGVVNIKAADFNFNNINVDAEVRAYGETHIIKSTYTSPARTINFGTNAAATYTSPIIVDFNRDGVVSAASGEGVDVNGDGIADGYATGGDKMLAMSDMNGNGKIDGEEVFGDKTVNPFTGEAINAANGFEALKVVAQSAQDKTGITCYKDGFVDLQALKNALNSIGYNLGFISENNVTELEDLAHVAALNVDNYDEVDAEGDVQHRQQGSYVDNEGNTYAANDVWFKNRTVMDQMISKLKNN
jgi:hypothetical protein